MVRKWHQFQTKKIVKAKTRHELDKAVRENETRNWKSISAVAQHYNGVWCCVMEWQPRH